MSHQIAICSYFNPDLPPEQVFELIIRSGFNAISVWGAGDPGTAAMPDYYKQFILAARDVHGLVLESLHAPFELTTDLSSPDNSLRTKALDRLKLAINDALELQIPIVIIHAHRGEAPQQLSALGQRSFTELIEAAAAANILLAVENTLDSIAPLEWILSQFPASTVGLCYDSGHDQLIPGQTFDLLQRWGHRLLTTHIHDNLGQSDDHLIPGQGTIDWPAFVRAFPWQTYNGYLTLEATMANSPFTDPAEFLSRALAAANHLLTLQPS